MVTRESFVDSLPNAKDVNEHYAFIESCAARDDIDTLRALFDQTREQCSFGPSDWAPRAACERIVEALALTDGFDHATAALELSRIMDNRGDSSHFRPSGVISKLVAAQSSSVLEQLLECGCDLESDALILHEAVVRRKLTPESRPARDAADRLASAQHPLSFLPLVLLDIEAELLLPHYGMGSSGTSIPFGPLNDDMAGESEDVDDDVTLTETTTHDRSNRISAALKNWEDESNGLIEARTFDMRDGTIPMLSRLLPTVGLECIGPSDAGVFHDDRPVKFIFTVLFSAASTGGAYNYGEFAAYGRLLAWRSLAGLVGCHENASIEETAVRARDSKWCLFSSSSDWYYQVAWDIGVACVNPTQNELVILAATDTD
ncbi:MAG: DUF6183 family protein [Rubripirellula sp.]|nr:DUF6183 family protein [Rubripirellula sp.]